MTPPDFLAKARTFYDAFAAAYSDRIRDGLDARPMDRAMLALFAELVRAEGGQVADLLTDAGLSVRVRAVREPDQGEGVPRAHLLACRT